MAAPPNAHAQRRPSTPPQIIRHGFLAVMVLWLMMPLVLHGQVAQDAIPYLAAGKLAQHHPHDVYAARHGNLFDLEPTYRRQWCELAPIGTGCDDLAVAFVSTPPVVPLTVLLARLGPDLGALAMRIGATVLLVAGMWELWKRLAHRTRHGGELLLVTALALTPMAMVPIGLGQTSPVMFLSVCLGLSASSSRRRVAVATTWAASTLIKLIPGALIVLLVARRRWRTLSIAAAVSAVLAAASFAVVPVSTWGDFVRTTWELSGASSTNPYNGSFNALLARVLPGSQAQGPGAALVTLLCVAAGASICWVGMRRTDDDTRWAVGYLALLFVTPLVWWHYVWVGIGALAVALAGRRRLDDRLLAVLPATAVVSIIPSIPNARGWSLPVPQALFLIALTAVVLALTVHGHRGAVRAPTPAATALE